jgi:hypothetical protein
MIGLAEKGSIYKCDAIEYEGKIWLVPQWRARPRAGWQTPERIICLDNLPHQKMPPGSNFGDFVLNGSIPTAVLEGRAQAPEASGYEIVESPNIQVSIPKRVH